MIYNYDEVYNASLEYFNGDDLATKVFIDKYALRNKDGEFLELTPDDSFKRISKEFARIEKDKFKHPMTEEKIYSLLKDFKYIIPQGSPMYGIGNTEQYVSLSNCFVLTTPEDSYSGIMSTDTELVQVSKRRGGVGIDLSKLRPSGAPTNNAARTSTGITAFMQRYSNSINEVGQSGRRGALMLTIDVHHPQILDFATIKNDLTKVTGANISVKFSNEFLNAVKNNTDYELRFPVDARKNNKEPEISKMVSATMVWNEIVKNAHAMAEPGILFWDNILENSPADSYSKYGFNTVSTNPCVAGDTLVKTENGDLRIDKIIEMYNNGEILPLIYSYNIETEQIELDSITNAAKTREFANIIEIEMEDGKILKLTPDHLVYTKNRGYIEAAKLNEDDDIITY